MKHLFEYINRNYTDIYENFVITDHVLTDEEINESFNRAINEGFWSWLGDLIKSMFTDSTIETKDFGESVFKYYDNNFDKKVADYNKKLFKENNVDKFIDLVDEMYEELIDKKILSEVEAIQWAIGSLSIKGRILKDEGKNSDVKKIENKINEYSEKNKKAAQDFTDDINKQQKEQKTNGNSNVPYDEIAEANKKVMSTEPYKTQIADMCKRVNTTPEQLTKILYSIVSNSNDLKGISDEKIVFSLYVTLIGGYLTQKIKSDRALSITKFVEVIALLTKNNKLFEK